MGSEYDCGSLGVTDAYYRALKNVPVEATEDPRTT